MALCVTSLNDLCDGKWGAGRKEAAQGGEVRESGDYREAAFGIVNRRITEAEESRSLGTCGHSVELN